MIAPLGLLDKLRTSPAVAKIVPNRADGTGRMASRSASERIRGLRWTNKPMILFLKLLLGFQFLAPSRVPASEPRADAQAQPRGTDELLAQLRKQPVLSVAARVGPIRCAPAPHAQWR